MAKLIGTIEADGFPIYPETTISGRAYKQPAITMSIPGGFIVIDTNLDPTFDYKAAVEAMGGKWEVAADSGAALSKAEAMALAAGQGMKVTAHTTHAEALQFIAPVEMGVNVPIGTAGVAQSESSHEMTATKKAGNGGSEKPS